MPILGWRGGGWPILRLLHGLSWQLAVDTQSLLGDIVVRGRAAEYRGDLRRAAQFPIVLDAGAHVGTDTLAFAQKWPSGMVFAVEPNADVFALLRSNVGGVPNVQAFHAAFAGEENVEVELYTPHASIFFPPAHAAGSTLFRPLLGAETMHEKPTQRVRAHTLDSFFEEVGVGWVDVLHLDMQGAEYEVLSMTSSGLLRRVLA